MKKKIFIIVISIFWNNYSMAACAVVDGKTYGDCRGVKVNIIPHNSNPAVLSGNISGMINGNALVKSSATVNGMVNGNVKIEKNASLNVSGTVEGSIENYGKLYVNGAIAGNIINFDSGTATIEGTVSGELFGENFKAKPGSIISGIPTK
jgi:cytoskeletal protein CcmA (bactofilin family)